jgi:hypothetical protein
MASNLSVYFLVLRCRELVAIQQLLIVHQLPSSSIMSAAPSLAHNLAPT